MPQSRKTSELLLDLKAKEELSVVRGLGSLAFVRAQGRTLEERSQEKVLAQLWVIRGELESIQSPEQFDQRHHAWVENALQVLRTNRNNQLAYGQGQKTINVFLKFYVDWASRPTSDAAARLRPWLHCPLDRVVMEALRSHDTEPWRGRICVGSHVNPLTVSHARSRRAGARFSDWSVPGDQVSAGMVGVGA